MKKERKMAKEKEIFWVAFMILIEVGVLAYFPSNINVATMPQSVGVRFAVNNSQTKNLKIIIIKL